MDHEAKRVVIMILSQLLVAMAHVIRILARGRTSECGFLCSGSRELINSIGSFIGAIFTKSDEISTALRKLDELEKEENSLLLADLHAHTVRGNFAHQFKRRADSYGAGKFYFEPTLSAVSHSHWF